MHKSGFVNIIGSPNVGKSTLMNQLVGERISIITSKAQTTRHRIKGIVNGEDYQIVYSDTPGVLKPAYKLHDAMLGFVNEAFSDADVLLVVVDAEEEKINNDDVFEKILKTKTPMLLLLNKIDIFKSQEELNARVEYWKDLIPNAEVVPFSALNKFNMDHIQKRIVELLPQNPPFYPKDQLTDKSERFFVEEKLREKILLYYEKEIPYSVEVLVTEFKELPEIIRISTDIYVMRESQKGIIIGPNAAAIKRVGTAARKDLEVFFQKKIFLETFVKVKKDWRNDDNQLKRFGYR
ncbi:MAG: GTPase Era [Bacteroidia bacterium]